MLTYNNEHAWPLYYIIRPNYIYTCSDSEAASLAHPLLLFISDLDLRVWTIALNSFIHSTCKFSSYRFSYIIATSFTSLTPNSSDMQHSHA